MQQQNAWTYDPIIGQPRELSAFSILDPREAADPGVALVLLREGTGLEAILQPRRLTAGETLFGRIRRVYRVDMTEHRLEWQSWLHSHNDEWVLLAHIQVHCQVLDPIRVVENNVRDAYAVLEPALNERMRRVVDHFEVNARSQAEQAVTDDLRSGHAVSDYFTLRWVGVRLGLDQTVMEQKRKSMEHGFYVDYLQRGDFAALALQLAHNPNAIDNVVDVILRQRAADANLQLEALKAYLEHGALEGFQLEGAAKELLHKLAQTWQAASQGLPAPNTTSPGAVPPPVAPDALPPAAPPPPAGS